MSELEDTADHLVVVGRGRVIADTSVADLIAAASGDRITLRTTAPADAMTVLASAGAEVTATGPACSRFQIFHQNESWRSSPATPSPSARSPPTGPPLKRPTWNSPGRASSTGRRRHHDDRSRDTVPLPADRGAGGFWHLVHAEWTKFRTVRGWVIAVLVTILAITAFAFLAADSAADAPCQRHSSGQRGRLPGTADRAWR